MSFVSRGLTPFSPRLADSRRCANSVGKTVPSTFMKQRPQSGPRNSQRHRTFHKVRVVVQCQSRIEGPLSLIRRSTWPFDRGNSVTGPWEYNSSSPLVVASIERVGAARAIVGAEVHAMLLYLRLTVIHLGAATFLSVFGTHGRFLPFGTCGCSHTIQRPWSSMADERCSHWYVIQVTTRRNTRLHSGKARVQSDNCVALRSRFLSSYRSEA